MAEVEEMHWLHMARVADLREGVLLPRAERELVVSVLGMYGLDDDRISSWLHLSTENVRQIRHRARRKIQNARN